MTPSRICYKAPHTYEWVPGVSYGSYLTIDTKKVPTSLCMMWLWHHNQCCVKNSENCQKSSKSRGFAIFVTKMCSFVVVIGVRVHLGMASFKINSICSLKHEKPHFCAFPIEKYRLGRSDPLPSNFDGTPWTHWRWYLWFFFTPKWPQRMNLQLPISVW